MLEVPPEFIGLSHLVIIENPSEDYAKSVDKEYRKTKVLANIGRVIDDKFFNNGKLD